ncbi:MarR family winged helix-turn-helix transcriptional regulator [Paucidesulfovibrio longus]|uniref:MarR family winged helix-turn-helix transcriptional regulator n=1 Tax=Paucidesulfovibrio longus TaxID=889 RepID=UPI0003B55156|nr:MarR family transcriptional regulator [Paucidesulfovibrio longus]
MQFLTKHRSQSAGYRIGRLFRANAKLGDRLFQPTGVTRGQLPVIMEVLHDPGRSQKDLARELHVDAAAIARALHILEDKGLIRREENPDCRRDKCVHPTAAGEALLPRLLDALNRHNEMLLAGFSAQERDAALLLLERIIRNVELALEEEAL